MQQTKSYWRLTALAAVAGVVTAFVGSACTVTTSTDDSGFGGDSFAGAATFAGAPSTAGSAGSTATAGSSGAPASSTYECDPDNSDAPAGTPYPSCTADDANDPCAVCIQGSCCTEYEQCYATNPGDQCGYGGPGDLGEISCVQTCIQKSVHENGVFDSSVEGTCVNECLTQDPAHGGTSSKNCGQVIGLRTSALIGCMTDHCQTECYGDGS